MVGGDIVVAWYDKKTGDFHADDYYMSATAQVGDTAAAAATPQ